MTMKKISLKYKLKKLTVRIKKVWDFAMLNNKRYRLNPDIDLAMKIVLKMLSKDDCRINHSSMSGYFHLTNGHLYAKVSEQSITIINGRYAYELMITTPQAGYELHEKMKRANERRLIRAELEHRKRIDRSLQTIYQELDKDENNS